MTTPPQKGFKGPSSNFGVKLGTSMVDIFVGPSKEVFRVHKDRLCARAPVFDRMFNGGYKEATEQRAELPEDDPEAFNVFLEWLYTSRLTQPTELNETNQFTWTWSYLKVYCFAEKYCLSELMNQAVSTLILTMSEHTQLPDCEEMAYIYANSSSGSHLRRFMALCLQFEILRQENTGCWKNEKLCKVMTSCNELTMDFISISRGGRTIELVEPSLMNPCDFHVHEVEGECVVKNDRTFPKWIDPSPVDIPVATEE